MMKSAISSMMDDLDQTFTKKLRYHVLLSKGSKIQNPM